ncbi:DNA repair protein REV1 isoform X1 [Rosa chinensis]|uniref:DNA repair protein REV1 isoform X1 n=2 Tax=Rosa chinensis TaxID=74649 RepID=UPI001AD8CF58|nr:DNA repair protein REV1 isoform X1 [Rosa chinensis]XP_040373012.1 DNA repair protein REV1 isoform X1 [Rosa chinensis]XP_040373026.1 DNA repair protein REV1 isoform X1 [Rosa chinensis]XP_040373043.1 DNA repair protein REV1 isoform X1 [Rosa chinensis]XP_040373053.1 DNA repair protein REV1 isoform X1 [Rosa chinensis]XP_040373063.1 DNA repair protein REV1 isoform X1 [Rosa chinensis]
MVCFGVMAAMFVRDAKALCPHLVILPYDFAAYEEVANQFYDILHKHCRKVQAVSCDEAFLDVTFLEGVDMDMLASIIIQEIFETTGCIASAGIARNMLMPCLTTRTAKPDGRCNIPPKRGHDYLYELPIKTLLGIGHVLEEKLKKRNVLTCGQLRMIPKPCNVVCSSYFYAGGCVWLARLSLAILCSTFGHSGPRNQT